MAKRERWLLRVAVDLDGGLTSANKAMEELANVRAALEEAGYLVLDHRGMAAPMNDAQKKAVYDANSQQEPT